MRQYFKFDIKHFIYLSLAFMLMTIVGTLSHELGHYSVAKVLGYQSSINYQSASYWDEQLYEYFNEVYDKYKHQIKNKLDFPGKDEYQNRMNKYHNDSFWIALGGPVQTMFTGTFGITLLLIYRNKFLSSQKVNLAGWCSIFLSLFWLRQVANLFVGIGILLITGNKTPTGDEMRLALYLNYNVWSIQLITGAVGLIVLFVVLRLLPKPLVLTFLLSGLTGGVLGYYLWLIKFGKYIMP